MQWSLTRQVAYAAHAPSFGRQRGVRHQLATAGRAVAYESLINLLLSYTIPHSRSSSARQKVSQIAVRDLARWGANCSPLICDVDERRGAGMGRRIERGQAGEKGKGGNDRRGGRGEREGGREESGKIKEIVLLPPSFMKFLVPSSAFVPE